MRPLRVLTVLALAAGVLTCGGDPPGGDVVFQLTTPNQDDGAVQFSVRAAEPNTVSAVTALCGGCQVYSQVVSDTEIRGVLVGDVVAGPVLSVTVSDRGADAYVASVVSAASRTYALRAVEGYALNPTQ
jgi:hypothetical protein